MIYAPNEYVSLWSFQFGYAVTLIISLYNSLSTQSLILNLDVDKRKFCN
jgi:hypothetical protein